MDDLINRQALLIEMQKGTIISDDLYGMGIMSGIDSAIRKINEAPAIEGDIAEIAYNFGIKDAVVHGWWETIIDADEFWGDLEYHKCNRCGKIELKESEYCPNCGAKMDLEEP